MTTDSVAVWAEAPRPSDRQPVMGLTSSPTGLPWPHHPEDLRHFREVTRDRVMVMGLNTFRLLPSILKSRRSLQERPIIVLTKDRSNSLIDEFPGLDIQPIAWAKDEEHAEVLLNEARGWFGPSSKEVAVIGGRRVIELFAPLVDRLEVTFFREPHEGDVPAPSMSVFDGFTGATERTHPVDPTIDFVTFTKE